MVKPAQGGSGLGAAVVREAAALPAAMVGCFAYDSTALVERFVPGTDVAVSIVDLGAGPHGAARPWRSSRATACTTTPPATRRA